MPGTLAVALVRERRRRDRATQILLGVLKHVVRAREGGFVSSKAMRRLCVRFFGYVPAKDLLAVTLGELGAYPGRSGDFRGWCGIVVRGNLDAAKRTVVKAWDERLEDDELGVAPDVDERMRSLLRLRSQNGEHWGHVLPLRQAVKRLLDEIAETRTMFDIAQAYCLTHDWEADRMVERFIFERYAEGVLPAEIVAESGLCRSDVMRIIAKHKVRAGIPV